MKRDGYSYKRTSLDVRNMWKAMILNYVLSMVVVTVVWGFFGYFVVNILWIAFKIDITPYLRPAIILTWLVASVIVILHIYKHRDWY